MILVTGATGLVGGHLMWHLLQENERITAIRRTDSNLIPLRTIFSFYCPNPDDYLARIDWKMADVLNAESLHQAMHRTRVVYHCAAVVSLGNGTNNLLDTNITGTRNVVRAALSNGVERFCFVSSIAACGAAPTGEPIDENTVWNDSTQRSAYSQSKYYSEQEVWAGIRSGLNAVIVNPGVILGVSGNTGGSSQLFAQVQKGLIFYTNGGSGYVDVQDVVKIMIRLTTSSIVGERFVLTAENCSNKHILSQMAIGFGKQPPFIGMGRPLLLTIGFLSEVLGNIFHFRPLIDRMMARTATHRQYYSSAKVQQALNFSFKPIDKTINEVCEFMLRKEKVIR